MKSFFSLFFLIAFFFFCLKEERKKIHIPEPIKRKIDGFLSGSSTGKHLNTLTSNLYPPRVLLHTCIRREKKRETQIREFDSGIHVFSLVLAGRGVIFLFPPKKRVRAISQCQSTHGALLFGLFGLWGHQINKRERERKKKWDE